MGAGARSGARAGNRGGAWGGGEVHNLIQSMPHLAPMGDWGLQEGPSGLPALPPLQVTHHPWSPGQGQRAPRGRAGNDGHSSVRSRGPEPGPLAAPQGTARASARGRLFNRAPHPSGGPPPWRTCSHPRFPRSAPNWERPSSLVLPVLRNRVPAGRPPRPLPQIHPVHLLPASLYTCFLPPCVVRACAAVCTPGLPWHTPRAILSGEGRQPDSRPARSQVWPAPLLIRPLCFPRPGLPSLWLGVLHLG